MRIGLGYDIHPLVNGRRFLLGGVEIPSEKGSVGHSDGDCLFHAVGDALLGAAGLGDMGGHFPDTDPKWRNADSSLFLKEIRRLLEEKGFWIENIDANLHLEKPQLGPLMPQMIQNLAGYLGLPEERINLKAKRGEKMDAVGRGEAVVVQVSVLIQCH